MPNFQTNLPVIQATSSNVTSTPLVNALAQGTVAFQPVNGPGITVAPIPAGGTFEVPFGGQ